MDTCCTFEMIQEDRADHGARIAKVRRQRQYRAQYTGRGKKIEGHFCSGGTWMAPATIDEIQERPGEVSVKVSGAGNNCSRYIVKKGSIAIDGISLTVTEIKGQFGPHIADTRTPFQVTNFKNKKGGATL